MNRLVKEGAGWRLGWNPDAEIYRGLIAGADWAVELTEAELDDFCRLLLQLAETMVALAPELMEEERLCCEAESDRLWLEAEGFPMSYGVRVILHGGRRAEGYWPSEAVPGLVGAARALKTF